MTTKTMTATAPENATASKKSIGPNIKTALPGPNARRVLAGDEIYFAVLYPLLPARRQERTRYRCHRRRRQRLL